MPFGRDLLPETNYQILEGQDWRTKVRLALRMSDTEALGALFISKVHEVGIEKASQEWLEIISGWDASAVTG